MVSTTTCSIRASGGASSPQREQEGIERGLTTLEPDLHLAGDVPDPAGQPVAQRQPVHEGPEADPLHHAGDRTRRATAPVATVVTLAPGPVPRRATASRRKPNHSSSPSPVSAEVKKKLEAGIDLAGQADRPVHVEGHVGQQVDLVEHRRTAPSGTSWDT